MASKATLTAATSLILLFALHVASVFSAPLKRNPYNIQPVANGDALFEFGNRSDIVNVVNPKAVAKISRPPTALTNGSSVPLTVISTNESLITQKLAPKCSGKLSPRRRRLFRRFPCHRTNFFNCGQCSGGCIGYHLPEIIWCRLSLCQWQCSAKQHWKLTCNSIFRCCTSRWTVPCDGERRTD